MPPRWRTDMSRKSKRHFRDPVFSLGDEERRRSFEVPLLWLGVAAFVGFPVLRDATSDKMQRNRYGADRYSCECDYGPERCSYRDGNWVGPWYAVDLADRKSDDPGRGACRERGSGSGSHIYGYSGASSARQDAYRGPSAVEAGYRGGFGGTGRVRAAGS